ncbi:MAG TPA: hypothetical protein VFQ28_10500, partial [Gaiella sp.]|nr:hypothetical protein [Gaiella sp.]
MSGAVRVGVVALAATLAAVALASLALGGGSATSASRATPDFARDVAPIVRETCAGCHRIGGIAPFAFRTERDLAGRAAPLVA